MCAATWMQSGEHTLDDIFAADVFAADSFPVDIAIDQPSWRLIPSRYPPIKLFETLLDPQDLELAYQLESLTNDRLRDQAGDIHLVAPQDRLVGPGASVIMAAFTHTSFASRFTDGRYGVYYAGLDPETALRESLHSQARRLHATLEGPQVVQMRSYIVQVKGELHDGRENTAIHHKDDWSAGQQLGRSLKLAGALGIVYCSVRHAGGECIAALRPAALKLPVTQSTHYEFHWDGERFTHYSEIRGEL